jgi:hypothetical protein
MSRYQIVKRYQPDAKQGDLDWRCAFHPQAVGAKHIHAHPGLLIDTLQHVLARGIVGMNMA